MYNVLIADDESIIREGLKCVVDWVSLGFHISGEAANGDDVLHFIAEHNPDVVLLDIQMPKMLGLEAIRDAREHGFTGKVIILSGYSDFNYAQEAIRQGVQHYLTKPIDEDELTDILIEIKQQLDQTRVDSDTAEHYREKAHNIIVHDILLGSANFQKINQSDMNLNSTPYQVVIYEKYSHDSTVSSYRFSDLLRVTNQDYDSYDNVTIQYNEVILLKGSFSIQKFNEFLERYEREKRPQLGSPLDSLFITYGRCVSSLEEVHTSYYDAYSLLQRRFFCDQAQHTIGYEALPTLEKNLVKMDTSMLSKYANLLQNYLQAFNRNMVAETLHDLQNELYISSNSIDSIKLLLADLYLQIKEHMNHLYSTAEIPFPSNTSIIQFIEGKYYLYEIILFFTEQFENIMSAIGNSTRDSVLDDILHYINHNYAANITLENIAPLFGYNSSYLGKIFSKKMGENFNSYVDHIRIEHSKKLLLNNSLKVYMIAEKVGYRNVDYFHIKFKKCVGESPSEYRKKCL